MQSSSSDPLDLLGFGSLNLDSSCTASENINMNGLLQPIGDQRSQQWELDLYSSPKSISPHSQSDNISRNNKYFSSKDLSRDISLDHPSSVTSADPLISLLDSTNIMATTTTNATFQNYYPTPDLTKPNCPRVSWAESPLAIQQNPMTQPLFNTPSYGSVLDYQFDSYLNPGIDSNLSSMIDIPEAYHYSDLMSSVSVSESIPNHHSMSLFLPTMNPSYYHLNHMSNSTISMPHAQTPSWSSQSYPMLNHTQDISNMGHSNISLTTPHPLVVSNVHINRQRPKRIPKPKKIGDYKCEYPGCGKLFTRPYNLKAHARIHTLERPFICEVCKYSFSRLHDMRRHMKLHSGVKPFTCPYCSKSFARLDAMNRHIKKDKFTCTTGIKMANLAKNKAEKGKRGRLANAALKQDVPASIAPASITSTSTGNTEDFSILRTSPFNPILPSAEDLLKQDTETEFGDSFVSSLFT